VLNLPDHQTLGAEQVAPYTWRVYSNSNTGTRSSLNQLEVYSMIMALSIGFLYFRLQVYKMCIQRFALKDRRKDPRCISPTVSGFKLITYMDFTLKDRQQTSRSRH